MKKLFLILTILFAFSLSAQTYQNPTFGTITSKTNIEDNSATKVVVKSSDDKMNWRAISSILPSGIVTQSASFTAGRIPYTTGASSLADSNRLLWTNTTASMRLVATGPSFGLTSTLNPFGWVASTDANGTFLVKSHENKPMFVVSNPVGSTNNTQFGVNVTSVPAESQLYVYGGNNGANIDARGSTTRDEANIDLEGNDWESDPNSLGFSYFGSLGTNPGTILGYSKNKLGQVRFQNSSTALITSINGDGSFTPIRFGINTAEVASISNNGLLLNTETANTVAIFDSSKQVKSASTATYPNLSELAFLKGVTSSIQNQFSTKINGSATAGQVSFWNSTNSQTGDSGFIWDNTNKKLGIGSSSPIGKLDLFTGISGMSFNLASLPFGTISFGNSSTPNTAPTITGKSDDSIGLSFISGTNDINPNADISFNVRRNTNSDFTTLTTSAFRYSRFSTVLLDILRNGNAIYIGKVTAGSAATAANDLIRKGEHDADLVLKANLASPTFTGTVTTPNLTISTAPSTSAGTYDLLSRNTSTGVVEKISSSGIRPYKAYVGIFNQSGTSAPTVSTIMENTIGSIVWSRTSTGTYVGTLTGAFTTSKTIAFLTNTSVNSATPINVKISSASANTIDVLSYVNGALSDNAMGNMSLEIRVYN